MANDSLVWTISDGTNVCYLYPDDLNYIRDGLKKLDFCYKENAYKLYCAGMPNNKQRIKNKIVEIHELMHTLGGSDDYDYSDITLQEDPFGV